MTEPKKWEGEYNPEDISQALADAVREHGVGAKRTCQKCERGAGARYWPPRCEEHNACDDCGAAGTELTSCSEGLLCDPCLDKFVQGLIDAFDDDTDSDYWVICPYCGLPHTDAWDYEGGTEYECERCRNKFSVRTETVTLYSTEKVD